jgi:threonine synthase
MPPVGSAVGLTPLVRARNLGEEWGVRELYIKNDGVCHPTCSFKDRVVAMAMAKAIEFGFDTVACASTGNLANSVAAHAAEARLKAYVFIPVDLEQGKVTATLVYNPTLVAVQGTYDEVNRLCSEIADKYRWAFANINLRPYYGEGSKTVGYEIAEQLGWRAPGHVVVPCAGGSLLTKVAKAFAEWRSLGLIPEGRTRVHAAQAAGCGPIVTMIKNDTDVLVPVRPDTIARSLAIGNPGRWLLCLPGGQGVGGIR